MTIKHLLPGLRVALLLAGAAWLWLSPGPTQAAPDVSVRTLDGNDIRLTELHGHPTLVTFWANTCGDWLEEMPPLIKLYNELAPNGLEIVAVAMSYDPPNRVVAMPRAPEIPYSAVPDIDQGIAHAFGDVSQTPTSFLIAPDGDIAIPNTGRMDTTGLRKRILEIFEHEV